jgi:CHRD domain
MFQRSTRPILTIAAVLPVILGVLLAPPAQALVVGASATTLSARLTPSGDADGSGQAVLTLNENKRKVCAAIHWTGISAPTYAHIHKVSDGSVVVDLTGAVTGGAKCTRGVPRTTIRRILNRPGRYYVNVHNATYAAGAIQGRLHR